MEELIRLREAHITFLAIIIMILLIFVPKIAKDSYLSKENRGKHKIFLSILLFCCILYAVANDMPLRNDICLYGCLILFPLLPWVFKLLDHPDKDMYLILYYIYMFILMISFGFGLLL